MNNEVKKYYSIIGARTNKIIGQCIGEDGKKDVLREEPNAAFLEITEEQFYDKKL